MELVWAVGWRTGTGEVLGGRGSRGGEARGLRVEGGWERVVAMEVVEERGERTWELRLEVESEWEQRVGVGLCGGGAWRRCSGVEKAERGGV